MNDQSNQIGVLWKNEKVNVNGKTSHWYSGNIKCPHCQEETKIVEFHNIDKKTDRHPDKSILVRKSKEDYEAAKREKKQAGDPTHISETVEKVVESIDNDKQQAAKSDSLKEFEETFDDDIPF